MPRRIPAILAAVLLAAPVMAQEAETTAPLDPLLILPAPEATEADTAPVPETVQPASSGGCSRSKAVTS